MTASVTVFDPLLGAEGAEAMLRLAEAFRTYRTYSAERTEDNYGDLPQRIDAASNYVRTGGRFGRRGEPLATLADRTNYFRETYAYGEEIRAPGIEGFLGHEGLLEAARRLHGRPVIVPAIVYANLLLPGQELAVHTDVPEFRGANRMHLPQWLMVVMHHSGLFEGWRMPIATAVAYFGDAAEGDFAHYPDGVDGAAVALPVRHDTAVLLDTDSVFHGVDRVGSADASVPPLGPAPELRFVGEDQWALRGADPEPVSYRWDDLRFSVSWKAYCFADEAERKTWAAHADDLTLPVILDCLDADLRAQGRLGGARPDPKEFAGMLIREYVCFPDPGPG